MRVIPDNVIVCDEERPVTIKGEPGNMSGVVRFLNRHDKRIVVSGGTLRFQSSHGGEDVECPVRMMAIVRPGQRADVPIIARIPATTPPGHYRGALTLGSSNYPARVLVGESYDTEISPSQILLPCRAGRVHREVFVTNLGNVPITMGVLGAVPLDDELASCRILRATLKKAPDSIKTINDWMDRYLREAGRHLEEVGSLWIEAVDGPITVEPGETVPVNLKIRIPELPSGSRCIAIAKFYDEDLAIIIAPTGRADDVKEGSDNPNGTTRARRTK